MNLTDQLNFLTGDPLLLFALLFTLSFLNVVFPPIPLESAALFGGYLAGAGRVSPVIIVGATASGMFLGSLLLYFLVKKFGRKFIDRTPLRHAFNESANNRAEQWLLKYGIWTALIGRFVPGMSLCVVIGFGLLRVHEKKAAVALLLSNLIFFSTLTAVGYFLGRQWGNALIWMDNLGHFWLILPLVVIGYGIWRFLSNPEKT